MGLMYCKKCGRLVQNITKCDCCKSQTYEVPLHFLVSEKCPLIKNDLKNQFIEELVKASPEFDQYLFDHRDEILAQKSREYQNAMEVGKALLEGKKVSRQEILSGKLNNNRTDVSCPYCHSYNTKKITVGSKAVHTAVFGIFSMSRNSKQFHCNNCGADF